MTPSAAWALWGLLAATLIESLAFAAWARRAAIKAERAHLRAEAAMIRAENAVTDILRIRDGEAAHRAER